MKRAVIAVVAVLAVAAIFALQPAWRRARRERDARRAELIESQLPALQAQKNWVALLEAYQTLSSLEPDNPGHPYDVACAHARLGHVERAFVALQHAVDLGFVSSLDAARDDDLATLRHDARFAAALEGMRKNARDGQYEQATPLPGLTTVEGYAPDGFRWRLRMSPDATAEHPHRLVVWLHPSFSPFNEAPEQLAPELAAHGWATLVITRKTQWEAWTSFELHMLLERTVPEAGKTPGIDTRAPVLLGYSAGGQMLLSEWQEDKPLDAAGLALVEAFPLELAPHARVPFFVRVGEADPWVARWREVEPQWRDAGVPLHVEYVPGAGHDWLLAPQQAAGFFAWLDGLTPARSSGLR